MASAVAVRVSGIARLRARLAKRSQVTDALLIDAMNKAAAVVDGTAKNLASDVSGTLRASIHPIQAQKIGQAVVSGVGTPLEYAPYVEFGTGIKGNGTYPNKAIPLAYRNTPWVYTPDDGKTFYWTEGQVAKPYMYPALQQSKPAINRLVAEAVVKGGK